MLEIEGRSQTNHALRNRKKENSNNQIKVKLKGNKELSDNLLFEKLMQLKIQR